MGVDKLTAFVQPQLNSHRQGQQKLSGRTALPQQCLQIGKCHKDHLMHSICRHVRKYTKGNTAQRASGDFARNLHTSDTKQTLIFHKNAREYIQYSLRFLFHLTKNLTTHLSHNLCAVLPKGILCKSLVRCCPEIFECLLHAFYNMPQKFVKHFRMFVAFGLVVYNFYIVSSLELSEIHNTYTIFAKNPLIFLTKYFLRSD